MKIRFKFGKPREWLPKLAASVFGGSKPLPAALDAVKSVEVDGVTKEPRQALLELIDSLEYAVNSRLPELEQVRQMAVKTVQELDIPEKLKDELAYCLDRLRVYIEARQWPLCIVPVQNMRGYVERMGKE